ncbi:MAG: DUF4352 domain-containing protein [Chloroflexi bacterium]|nr:MAG: DUF4352 domain-containing protein [Chloroflexota bacterium]
MNSPFARQKAIFLLIVGGAVILAGTAVGIVTWRAVQPTPNLPATATAETANAERETRLQAEVAATAASATATAVSARATEVALKATEAALSAAAGASTGPVLGQGETWDGLKIEIIDLKADAWPLIQAHNQFNDPPLPGRRMMLVTLRITNVSGDPQTPIKLDESDFKVMGSLKTPYTTYGEETRCGVVPDAVDGTLLPGQSMSGNICVQVPVDETGFVLIYDRYSGDMPAVTIPFSE